MSDTRLELVEPCEHGSQGLHYPEAEAVWGVKDSAGKTGWGVDRGPRCPGGSRRVLSAPTEEMVEAAAMALLQLRVGSIDSPTFGAFASDEVCRYQARTILTAAFNTLGIQEKADTTQNPS
jgi:hypothetical protein